MDQLVGHLTRDLNLGLGFAVVSLGPALGSSLDVEPT